MIQAARNGKSFSATELLALQVEVFRYSQTVEVISQVQRQAGGRGQADPRHPGLIVAVCDSCSG